MPFILLLLLLLAACSQQPLEPPPLPPQDTVRLDGVVQLRPAGQGIPARLVFTSPEARFEAISDSAGRYSVRLPAGRYNVDVLAEGMAASRVEGLELNGEAARLHNFVVLPRFHPDWPVEAPQVVLEGVVPGGSYTNSLSFRARLYGPVPARAIYVALGHTPGQGLVTAPQLSFLDTADTGPQRLAGNLVQGVAGKVPLEVVAYDQNNNRLHLLVPVNVAPGASATPLAPPAAEAVAYTFSGLLQLQATEEDAFSVAVRLSWPAYSWPAERGRRGFRIYRVTQEGETLLASLPHTALDYYDRESALRPGEEARYRVVAFVGEEESPGAGVTATPLAPFRVVLERPAQEEAVGPRPHFRWSAEPEVGAVRYYLPQLWDSLTGGQMEAIPLVGAPITASELAWEATGRQPLMPGKAYGWELGLAYAVDDAERPQAYSIAIDRRRALTEAYLPGPFHLFEVKP